MSGKLMVTRRDAFRAGGAATVALLGAAATARAGSAPAAADPLAHLRRSSYEQLAAPGGFALDGDGGTLRLTEIADLLGAQERAGLRGSDDAFALSFAGGAGEAPVAQGTRRISHPELGSFDLFLAPTAAGQPQYAAIVDRSVTPPRRPPAAHPPAVHRPGGAEAATPAGASTGDDAASRQRAEAARAAAANVTTFADAGAPQLLDATLTRGGRAAAVVALRLEATPHAARVEIALARLGRTAAQATAARPLDDGTLRTLLRTRDPRTPVPSGPGELVVTVVGADGDRRTDRRAVWLP